MDVNLKIPAIEQLLNMVASGIGAVGGPMLARWKALANADALRIEARGKADSIALITSAQAKARDSLKVIPSSTQGAVEIHNEEIQARLSFQEEKRQRNIETVVRQAADELGEKQVQAHDIDYDWTARFFADVQDVSSEGMQAIWAKILAGEAETPGRTSMQTLSILKNMSQEDAELFQRVTQFIMRDFVLRDDRSTDSVSGFPTLSDFMTLSHHNLFHLETGLSVSFEDKGHYYIKDGDVVYHIYKDDMETMYDIAIPSHILTPSGMELYEFAKIPKNEQYLGVLAAFLSGRYKGVKLAQGQTSTRTGKELIMGPFIDVEPRTPAKED